jgi:hypothetical protein
MRYDRKEITSQTETAQRSARVGICPLSSPLFSPPLFRAFFAGLSIGCSAGRGIPVSGPFSLHPRTTSTCGRLGVRIVSSTFPLARAQTSVGRIWLPVTVRYSLGWVCCSQLCLSVCSRNVYCICQPPTEPSPSSSFLRFVWSCSPPRCTCVLELCPAGKMTLRDA